MRTFNREVRAGDLVKAAVSGLAGGLAGTWFMTQVQTLVSAKSGEKESSREQPSPPVLLADRLSQAIRGRPISDEAKPKAGLLMHYGYGTLMGGAYGILSELFPPVGRGAGVPWGITLWVGGDEIALPLLKLAAPPGKYPASVHLSALAFHVAYGVATYGVCAGVRKLLEGEVPFRPRKVTPEREPEFELEYEEFVATGI